MGERLMQSGPRLPPTPVFSERRHGSLRMLASSCIVTAWLSLVLSILFGISLLAAPTPSLPTSLPGYAQRSPYNQGLGDDGLGGLGTGPVGGIGMLLPFASGFKVAGGIATIATGVLTFFFLAALGQAVYVLLDMEENTRITAQAMTHIARRMGQ
jgi:hypothetical protein